LYYFVIAPLREAAAVVLLRGSLTMRHGKFFRHSDDNEELEVQQEQRTSGEVEV
jgi:hypothetical protein